MDPECSSPRSQAPCSGS